MADPKLKSCGDCQHGSRMYADGFIYRDWSGKYEGNPAELKDKEMDKFWTYLECSKNNKGLKHINLDGKCNVFQVRK